MKTFNQIRAPKAGTVARILVRQQHAGRIRRSPADLGMIALFEKILIANRGEIALRIQRACRELGIPTVAVHSTADAEAMHVRLADESVCIGPPPAKDSYLNIPAILSAAAITGAEAIHPGYGFLAENAGFAEMVEAHGLTFIGPSPAHIRMMGDKIAAKAAMARLGVPLVPGSDGAVPDVAKARAVADRIGYPVLIKAAAGGGGRGMKVAEDRRLAGGGIPHRAHRGTRGIRQRRGLPREVSRPPAPHRVAGARRWARQCGAFRRARLQPAAAPPEAAGGGRLTRAERGRSGTSSAPPSPRHCPALGYRNAGTLEFLYQDGQFAFIEMNTRLQVEHPVTEMVCDIDLVREQIRIAAGAQLGYGQSDITFLRPRHRVPDHCRRPRDLHAVAGPGDGVPCAGRAGRTHRFGVVCRIFRAALLRQPGGQADRARADAYRRDQPPAPRAGRIRHRRHPDDDPAASADRR